MRSSIRLSRTTKLKRRMRRQRYGLATAIVVVLTAGMFSAVRVEATESARREREPTRTFTVACEYGICTFTAGLDPRTAENTTYEWNWGDGTKDTGRVVSHAFIGDDDSYKVTLKSIDVYSGKSLRERITCIREDYTLIVTSCE